jgi:hypothetical protein
MLTANPETIWSARRWIENTACTSASTAAAPAAPSRPSAHDDVTSVT